MRTVAKTSYLISEVEAKVKQFNNWYVGTSERDDVWRKNDADMIVFNVLDRDATWAAFEYFVNAGMKGKKMIGKQPNFLYLYSIDGHLPDGFIY